MKTLCLLLGAIVVALSICCARWYKVAEQLVIENHRLELQVRRDSLELNNAPKEEIRDAAMAIVDFDREHYGRLYEMKNCK